MVEILTKQLTPFEIAEGEAWMAGRRQRERDEVSEARRAEYTRRADPLFFGWQRGENSREAWLAVIEQIRQENPYPENEES